MNILIVESRYHPHVAQMLVDGATATLEKSGAHFERVAVPGALEIPPAIARVARGPRPFDGYIALGCIIGGETVHDVIFRETSRALMTLGLDDLAIGQGVLFAPSESAALNLAEDGDAGGEAARACVSLVTIRERAGYLR